MDQPTNHQYEGTGLAVTHPDGDLGMSRESPVVGILISKTHREATHTLAAVRRAGGDPILWTASEGPPDGVDGLVVSAAPTTEGQARGVGRDAGDWATWALNRGLPILATGGGFLALNVALGGSMAEVNGHAADTGDGEEPAYHRIFIAPGGKLASVVGSGGFVRVNSRHKLGVREAQKAPGLLATAYSLDDGVIEALESPEHPWAIGVQFDPERRGELPPHFDRLYSSLVAQARRL